MLSQHRTISLPPKIEKLEDLVLYLFNELKNSNPIPEEKELAKLNTLIKKVINTARKLAILNSQTHMTLKEFTQETGINIEQPAEITIDSTDENGYTMLVWAARQGHESTVSVLIDECNANLDIQARDDRRTALNWAAVKGRVKVVKLLVDAKAQTDIQDIDGNSAVMNAAQRGHQDILQLLAPEAKLELTNRKGHTALDEAIENKRFPAVRLLLDCKAIIRHPDTLFNFLKDCYEQGLDTQAPFTHLRDELQTRLTKTTTPEERAHWSILRDHTIIYIWATSKPSLSALETIKTITNIYDGSLLARPAGIGRTNMVRELIAAKAEVNAQSKNGLTALISAAAGDTNGNEHIDTVRELLAAKANVNIQGQYGYTALRWAAYAGHRNVAELLIQAGEKLELPDVENNTALDHAIQNKKISTVSLLLDHKASIRHPKKLFDFLQDCDQKDPNVLSSFNHLLNNLNYRLTHDTDIEPELKTTRDLTVAYIWAAQQPSYPPIIKIITDTINRIGSFFVGLINAASLGHEEAAKELIMKANASIDLPDKDGGTALIHVARLNYEDITTLLLQANADPNFYQEGSFYGLPPLMVAARWGNSGIVSLLVKDPRTQVNIELKSGDTALTIAALNGRTGVIRVLLTKENVNKPRKADDYTPLMCAAMNGHEETANILIEAKAALEAVNHDGETALDIAIKNKKLGMVVLLLRKGALIRDPEKLFDFLQSCTSPKMKPDRNILLEVFTYLANRLASENTHFANAIKRFLAIFNDLKKTSLWARGDTVTDNMIRNAITYLEEGNTLLIWAATINDAKLVEELLEKTEAKSDTLGLDDNTALMVAAYHGYRNIAELLIQAEANLEIINKNNHTALDYAIQNKKIATVSLLLDHKASIRHPKKLFAFLRDCDQKDPNVLSSFKHLLNELNHQLAHGINIDPELKTIRDLTIAYTGAAQQPSYPPDSQILRELSVTRLTDASRDGKYSPTTFKPKPKPELDSSSAPRDNARPGGF